MSTQDEHDLKNFLEGDSDYRRAYQSLPKAQPPAALDDAILAAARKQIARDVRPKWLVPLSLAATIVLGVGLSIRQLTPPTTQLPQHMVRSDAPAVAAADSAAAPVAKARELNAAAPIHEQTGADANGATPGADDPLGNAQSGRSHANAERDSAADTPARETSEQPAARARTLRPMRPAAPPAPAAAPMASRPQRPSATSAPLLEEASPAPPGATRDEQEARLDAAHNLSDAPFQQRAYAPAPADADTRAAKRQVVIATGNRLDVYTMGEPTPDERLKEISALHDAGREREARRLFEEFIEDWPDYELPKSFPYQRR